VAIISAPSSPIFTMLFSALRGTDKITKVKVIGTALAVVGALILLRVENFTFEGKSVGMYIIILLRKNGYRWRLYCPVVTL
jgi:drug/metabolite transporter (DMT)-like permease